MDRVVSFVPGDEDDARTPHVEHTGQFENRRLENLVEIEGLVDQRRQLGNHLESGDGNASAPGAEGRAHRVRSRSATVRMAAASNFKARRASATPAFLTLVPCSHALPNDSRRSA